MSTTMGGAPATGAAASPAAASKTPNVAKLAGKALAKQKIEWTSCGNGAPPTLECATITVPRNWKNPVDGETWDIAISYNRLNDEDDPRYKGAILGNPGGPGGPGLGMASHLTAALPDLNPYYNFIGMDPRGVGQSSSASCTVTYDETGDTYDMYAAVGQQCAQDPDVKTITSEQTAYDMDFIRHLLGLEKLNYFGYSYGTWLGNHYSAIFGENAGLMVLDSSLDVTQATYQHDKEFEPWAFDRRFRMAFLPWIARRDAEYGLGDDPEKIYQRAVDAGLNISDSYYLNVPTNGSGFFDLASAASWFISDLKAAEEAKTAGGTSAKQAAQGTTPTDYRKRLNQAEPSTDTGRRIVSEQKRLLNKLDAIPTVQEQQQSRSKTSEEVTFEFDAMDFMIRCGDGQYTQGENYWRAWERKAQREVPMAAGDWPAAYGCHTWRTQNKNPVPQPTTYPKTLVLQGEMDAQTVLEHGRESGTKLPNTSFIAVDNEPNHIIFPYGTEEVDRPVIDFYLTGKLPPNITVAQAKPYAGETQTYELWAPLNAKAKHTVSVNNDPFKPAEGTVTKRAVDRSGTQVVEEIAARQDFERWVGATYGPRGLAVIAE